MMRLVRLAVSATLVCTCSMISGAATRWSANHLIPDADLIKGNEWTVDLHGFYFQDEDAGPKPRPSALLRLGISEYVNIEGGYAATGATFAIKARVLAESRWFMPSLALGAHNIFFHKEVGYFDVPNADRIANEFYMALGKNIEPLSMRLHIGIQTIPHEPAETVNPFFSIENYFGSGLYTTVEVQRRHQEIVPSLFASYRFLNNRLELSLGFIDLYHMLRQGHGFAFSIVSNASSTTFSRPGIWIGLRFLGDLRVIKKRCFFGMDGQIERKEMLIDSLKLQLDSIRSQLDSERKLTTYLKRSLDEMQTKKTYEYDQLKSLLLEKIVALKRLFESNPFDPAKVREIFAEVAWYRGGAVGPLRDLLSNRSNERHIRLYAAMLLGEIAHPAGADALLEVLTADEDPSIKIEALIGLGKLRETRASYLLEQLAYDPDDGVALAAQEVLQRLHRDSSVLSGKRINRQEKGTHSAVEAFERQSKLSTAQATIDTDTSASRATKYSGGIADTVQTASSPTQIQKNTATRKKTLPETTTGSGSKQNSSAVSSPK